MAALAGIGLRYSGPQAAALGALVALAAALMFEVGVLRPIERIRLAMKRIREGDGGARLGWRRSDELGRLARDLDELAAAFEEKVDLEARLQQSQRLESVGRLAGGIAHDFNNLLMVISNSARFAAAELPDDAPAHDDVREIEAAADRAAALTRQLLLFSRRELTKPELVDLNAVVRHVETLLRRTIGENVELRVELVRGVVPVEADVRQLEQVLVNLVVNARDAMPDGGSVTIATDVVPVRVAPGAGEEAAIGRRVRLIVRDTGVGIDDDVASQAFEPFFTTKAKGVGSGLGLATVHGIVAQAGGTIELRRATGRGTYVKIDLPVAEGEPRSGVGSPGEQETESRCGHAVLLVEDEEPVRELVWRMLEEAGYRVRAASSGEEALEVAERAGEEIDLLLTDVVMPGMSGPELVKRLDALGRRPATVYMSGYAGDLLDRHGVDADGAGILAKPFTPEALFAALAGALAAAGTPARGGQPRAAA